MPLSDGNFALGKADVSKQDLGKTANTIVQLFDDFEELLNEADEWTKDGKKHREMMSAILSYK